MCQHRVTMQQAAHFPGREEQIVTTVFQLQKTITVRVTDHSSPDQIHFFNQAITLAPVFNHLPVSLHCFQPFFQGSYGNRIIDIQSAGNMLEGAGTVGLNQKTKDGFSSGYLNLVFSAGRSLLSFLD